MAAPPKETMQSLRSLISPNLSETPESHVAELLESHKAQLLSHIHSASSATESQIRYRSHLPTTRAHPEPTSAENQWLAAHRLPLPRYLAALHLRDYLHATYPTNFHSVLHSSSLMSYASPKSVLQFAKDEIQAAYDALTTILTNPKSTHFAHFRDANKPQIQDVVIKAVNTILSPASPQQQAHTGPDPPTVFALLLCATSSNFLSVDNILPILTAYVTAASSSSHYSLRALENDPLSVHLFTAAITTAIRQHAAQFDTLVDSFKPLLSHNSTLPALVSFSLASALRLKDRSPNDATVPQQDPSHDFVNHALSSDALGRIRLLLLQPFRVTDIESEKRMFRAFTEDVLSFLSVFRPSLLEHSQIEDLARLVSGLLERSEEASIVDISNSLWDDDDNSPFAKGLKSVLHLSAALYPLSFCPLISLLRVLAVDKRSAAHAVNFLEHRIMTMCETAEEFADAIIALDEGQDIIWERLGNYSRNCHATRALTKVKMGGNMVFVQAMREIPGGTYRRGLPAGTIGISDEKFTTVAWVHSWNGFGAVVYALDTLHDILRSDLLPSPDFQAVLEDLVDSVVEALSFVRHLSLNGSDTLRQHLCESFGIADTITRIVAEILQMKGKTIFSLQRLQTLLKSVTSCLPTLVRTDVKRAVRVASILSDTVKRENFAAVVSSFGEIASTALASFAYVSSVLSENTFQVSYRDVTMDCTRSEEGIDVFQAVVINLLCSRSFTDRSMAMTLENKSTTEWLLPLWTMRLFRSKPRILLSSSSAAMLFATIVMSTVSRGALSESDCLLYPTVCEAFVACVNALRWRSKDLSCLRYERAEQLGSEGGLNQDQARRVNTLTALEEIMLRPDIVEAMTLICCGGAKRLLDDKFYSGWIHFKDRYLLPVREQTVAYQPYDILPCHMINRESTADLRLSGTAARCLSLQMDCLSHLGRREDIHQIPWPSSSSTFDADACVGAVVRQRITKRISEGHGADLLGCLVAVLSCRQRAASRSLFGPRRSLLEQSSAVCGKSNGFQNEDKHREESMDPIPAVIFCLKDSFQRYQKLLVGHGTATKDEKLQFLKLGGQLSTMTAVCVRMLRLGLVSQNSRWFRDYIQPNFWELLTSLVRCGGSNDEFNSFDLKRTTHDWYAFANTNSLSKRSGIESYEQLVQNADYILDIASIWKGIAADVFHIASKEVLAEATESLLTTQSEKVESGNNYGLPDSLFRKPLFRSFAKVFSEAWVTVLLSTEPLREAINVPSLTTEMQDMRHLNTGPTLKQLTRHLSMRIIDVTTGKSLDHDVLSPFDRSGDLAVPYGTSYAYDITMFRKWLDAKNVSETLRNDLIIAVMDLNITVGLQDVYVEILSSFSSMASIVLFVDSMCPTQNLGLSYSSTQFRGKLCRYLPRILTSLLYGGAFSWHFVAVAFEVSKLLSMLSIRLTKEELEQGALTLIQQRDSQEVPAELRSSTPLGHICHVINRIISTENTIVWSQEESKSRHQIISWLLLTASRYTKGSAFHSAVDLQSLVRSCVQTLRLVNGKFDVCAAVSAALTETIANMPIEIFCSTFTNDVLRSLLSAVDTTANQFEVSYQHSRGTAISGLLLTLTRAVIRLRNAGNTSFLVSLRDVNASGVQPLLPTREKTVEAYDLEHENRNAYHTLWCSVLQLAAVTIPRRLHLDNTDVMENEETKYVIEFCSMHLERIVEDSLALQKRPGDVSDSSSPHPYLNFYDVTMGKVEEAELGAVVLSRLSPFGLILQNSMPNTIRHALEQLCRYTAQATRMLRTDPVERWVRPVTLQERERSGVAMEQLTSVGGTLPNEQSTTNMTPSPKRRSKLQLTSKRSPTQALRAALSGKPRQGLTPSPRSPFTPLMSPMPAANETRGEMSFPSLNSPWGDYGSGLITRTGESFGEEVSMSLIRGLCAALDAIRQFSEHLGIYPFRPTMETVDDAPGIGTLLTILKFACWELNKEGDEGRKACVQGIADTAMHLTLSHAMTYAETGALPQSVRDEVRKRVTTTLYRAKNLVPSVPGSSILRDEALMSLWKRF